MAYKRPIKNEKKIVRMYSEGMSLREIAAVEGCHKTTIKRRLEKAGVEMRGPGPLIGKVSSLPLTEEEKEQSMKSSYGMDFSDYEAMHKKQKGRCVICEKRIPKEWGEGVNIDHCHKSKKVRGLLCRKCNLGLGFFEDSPERLLAAASYLTAFRKGY